MRALVTGARGLLGAAIVREFASVGEVEPFDHATLDITDEPAVRRAVGRVQPTAVINCAAYNDVDAAEDDAVTALRVNALAVLSLARAAADAGATLVHYSTDFVFDGEATTPYTEADPPNPRGVYAASKLLGDDFALRQPDAFVLRVESLFGEPGAGGGRRGSLGAIVDKIRRGERVPVFVDRTVSPSYTADIARATRALLTRRAAPGLYHCVNSGAATWAEIAAEAAALLDLPLHAEPITLESARLKARRPKYSALANGKLAAAGFQMPAWQAALAAYLHSIQGVGDQRADPRPDREARGQAG